MIKKIVFLSLFFYLLTLLQTSFFIHFSRIVPNFVLISIILINLFEKEKNSDFGLISAVLGGFFLDVFSENSLNIFGFYLLISIFIYLFIKFVFKKYLGPAFKLS